MSVLFSDAVDDPEQYALYYIMEQEVLESMRLRKALEGALYGICGAVEVTGWDATKKGKVVINVR